MHCSSIISHLQTELSIEKHRTVRLKRLPHTIRTSVCFLRFMHEMNFVGAHLVETHSRLDCLHVILVRFVGGGNLTEQNRKQNTQHQNVIRWQSSVCAFMRREYIFKSCRKLKQIGPKTSNVFARDSFYFHFLSLTVSKSQKSVEFVGCYSLFAKNISVRRSIQQQRAQRKMKEQKTQSNYVLVKRQWFLFISIFFFLH